MLLLHPLRGAAVEQVLDLDDYRSPVQGLHTRLGVLQVCEVLVLEDWVLRASPRVSNN